MDMGTFNNHLQHFQANNKRFGAINYCPVLHEDTKNIETDRHYLYHLAWAARVLAETKPTKHIDVGSLFNWATIVSAFVPVDYYEFRPPIINLSNYESKQGNLTALPFVDNSVESISCMHTIEHVGLGRYGDPLDVDGDIKAINELIRVTKIGGNILFVVPTGNAPVIFFNAHRIYTYQQVVNLFSTCTLKEFAFISDTAPTPGVVRNADPNTINEGHGCGCYWFIK